MRPGAAAADPGRAPIADGAGRPVELAAGRLYALPLPYALDGRVSTHPRSVRGFASMNCYVVLEGDDALLIDTGMSSQGDLLVSMLESLLPAGARLSIWPTRLGEFNATCNVRLIAERFGAEVLYGNFVRPGCWVDFRPQHAPYGTPVGGGALERIETRLIRLGDRVAIDRGGQRILQVMPAPLRLLPTTWIYDEATRTLFTGDAFSHVWRATVDGPWEVADGPEAPTPVAELCEQLLYGRFWWLAGARTDVLRDEIDALFAAVPVDNVAPGFGAVLRGPRVVRRHRAALDAALTELGRQPSVGLAAATWSLKEGTDA